MPLFLDAVVACAALAMALALRPWRALERAGPPAPWLACWAALPLLWGADRFTAVTLVQPLSGASLLLLLAGWPLAVPAMAAAAAVTMAAGALSWADALHRLVWLGVVPATLALMLGAALRRWLPNHLFVYILGRGFFATWLATAGAGALALALTDLPAGSTIDDLLIARWLVASGEAVITGMLVAIFVAYRPQWLATYSDRLYLPPE